MQAARVADEFLFPGVRTPVPSAQKPSALRSLMQMWDEEQAADEGESEVELMIAFSGMVGANAMTLDRE